MSKQEKKSCPPKKHRRARSRTGEAKQWRDLANEFLDRSSKHNRIRLLWADGRFDLFYVVDSETRLGEEVVLDEVEDAVGFGNPALESTFRSLATRGLLLAGRKPGASVWQSWAEFLVDTLPCCREDLQTFGGERQSYLRSRLFHLVDESVVACEEMERKVMTENVVQPLPRFYPRGLRAVRESRHYNQEGLSKMMDCCERTVRRWESGKVPMNPDRIPDVCKALECEPEELSGERPPSTPATHTRSSR